MSFWCEFSIVTEVTVNVVVGAPAERGKSSRNPRHREVGALKAS